MKEDLPKDVVNFRFPFDDFPVAGALLTTDHAQLTTMPDPTTQQKQCLSCGKVLHGRADKKFCNDYCRNAYNNNLKATTGTLVRNINNALLKNRRILENVLGEEEMQKTTKDKLLQLGFQFKYLTHTYTNKKGNTYSFCYEYGYLPLDHDWYLIVRRNEKS